MRFCSALVAVENLTQQTRGLRLDLKSGNKENVLGAKKCSRVTVASKKTKSKAKVPACLEEEVSVH